MCVRRRGGRRTCSRCRAMPVRPAASWAMSRNAWRPAGSRTVNVRPWPRRVRPAYRGQRAGGQLVVAVVGGGAGEQEAAGGRGSAPRPRRTGRCRRRAGAPPSAAPAGSVRARHKIDVPAARRRSSSPAGAAQRPTASNSEDRAGSRPDDCRPPPGAARYLRRPGLLGLEGLRVVAPDALDDEVTRGIVVRELDEVAGELCGDAADGVDLVRVEGDRAETDRDVVLFTPHGYGLVVAAALAGDKPRRLLVGTAGVEEILLIPAVELVDVQVGLAGARVDGDRRLAGRNLDVDSPPGPGLGLVLDLQCGALTALAADLEHAIQGVVPGGGVCAGQGGGGVGDLVLLAELERIAGKRVGGDGERDRRDRDEADRQRDGADEASRPLEDA